MATARINAAKVEAAAALKVDDIELRCAEWRKEQIAKVQAEDDVTGPFWRQKVRTLTWEEAEAKYDRLCTYQQSKQWWDELEKPQRGLGLARKIHRLAVEAIRSGDGFVSLAHDEVSFLGLGAAA